MESASIPITAAPAGVIDQARVKKLVLFYVGASTAFFFVSGLLGVMMRESQANLATLDPKFFYAIMTAHGLGAFVAWAAFAVMQSGSIAGQRRALYRGLVAIPAVRSLDRGVRMAAVTELPLVAMTSAKTGVG